MGKLEKVADSVINKAEEKLETKDPNRFNLYVKVRKWIQPFWNPKPKRAKKPEEKSISTHGKETKLKFRESKIPLTTAWKLNKQPNLGECWTFHNGHLHQIWCHLDKNTGFDYGSDERSNEERQKTNLCIRPATAIKGSVDRTHMLPFGYHGLENDERLVIGWNGEANRGPFNEFEQKMKNINKKKKIYWLCSVERLNPGARWRYIIFDENMKVIDSLEHTMKSEFIWDDYREVKKGERKKMQI